MFTGIVSELGTGSAVEGSEDLVRLRILAPDTTPTLDLGDSVAVNGVCLTAVRTSDDAFDVEAVPETLARTGLGHLEAGSVVNLERPLPADGRFDGHIVQGHVDGTGVVLSVTAEGDSVRMRCSLPDDLAPYVVEKGSMCVDGTSLTVTAVSAPGADGAWFEFALIPHTLDVTVFGTRTVGDVVNLEVDVIAKYVERMIGGRR